jgi:hypothetical protein
LINEGQYPTVVICYKNDPNRPRFENTGHREILDSFESYVPNPETKCYALLHRALSNRVSIVLEYYEEDLPEVGEILKLNIFIHSVCSNFFN